MAERFKVGGNPALGPDSQVVQITADPGDTVRITPEPIRPAWAQAERFDESMPTSELPRRRTFGEALGEAGQNWEASRQRFSEGFAQAATHPLETAENLYNLGTGVLQAAGILEGDTHKKHAEELGAFLLERYGSWDAVKNTLATDPVGLASDLASLGIGGGGLGFAAKRALFAENLTKYTRTAIPNRVEWARYVEQHKGALPQRNMWTGKYSAPRDIPQRPWDFKRPPAPEPRSFEQRYSEYFPSRYGDKPPPGVYPRQGYGQRPPPEPYYSQPPPPPQPPPQAPPQPPPQGYGGWQGYPPPPPGYGYGYPPPWYGWQPPPPQWYPPPGYGYPPMGGAPQMGLPSPSPSLGPWGRSPLPGYQQGGEFTSQGKDTFKATPGETVTVTPAAKVEEGWRDLTPSNDGWRDLAPAKPPPGERGLTAGQAGAQAIGNLWPSAKRFGRDTAQAVMHPIQTAENLYNIGAGALEMMGIKEGGENKKYAEAVGKYFSDRYGGWEKIKEAFADDPVGVLADASMALSGTGLAARVGTANRIAGGIGRAASIVDPVANVGRAVRVAGTAGEAAWNSRPMMKVREIGGLAKEAVAGDSVAAKRLVAAGMGALVEAAYSGIQHGSALSFEGALLGLITYNMARGSRDATAAQRIVSDLNSADAARVEAAVRELSKPHWAARIAAATGRATEWSARQANRAGKLSREVDERVPRDVARASRPRYARPNQWEPLASSTQSAAALR